MSVHVYMHAHAHVREMTLSWAVQPDPVLASTCVRRAALVALQGASFVKITNSDSRLKVLIHPVYDISRPWNR